MPVIIVTAPPLSSSEDEVRALGDVADSVAAALGLPADGVQVSCVHSATAVLGRRAVAPWPVVMIHGSPRAAGRRADAADRARDVVARAWQRSGDEVWVQWLVT